MMADGPVVAVTGAGVGTEVALSWLEVSSRVSSGKEDHVCLQSSTGIAKAGELLAVLGKSFIVVFSRG
jgi:hypothetical protein